MTAAGLVRLALIAAAVAIVELLCRTGVIGSFTMIPPSGMVEALWGILSSGAANADLLFTLSNTAASIVVSIVLGFLIGTLLHGWPRLRRVIDPFLAAYYCVPTFVFYPLLVVLLGVNRAPLISIGAMFGTVGMAVSVLDGMDRIPRALVKTGRLYRMGPLRMALLIKLPAITPQFLTGVKLATTYSLIGVIAGEFILSTEGLGRDIAFAYNDLDNQKMYAFLVLVLGVAILINSGVGAVEARIYRKWARR